MTKQDLELLELLAKHAQGGFLCGSAEAALQLIMATDVITSGDRAKEG